MIQPGTLGAALSGPPLYTFTVDVYEPGVPHPLVRHVFYGRTPTRARQVFRAHLKADAFLRGNVERGNARTVGPLRSPQRRAA
jgi:hypothetical protein